MVSRSLDKTLSSLFFPVHLNMQACHHALTTFTLQTRHSGITVFALDARGQSSTLSVSRDSLAQ
jgi:hypothetical protein